MGKTFKPLGIPLFRKPANPATGSRSKGTPPGTQKKNRRDVAFQQSHWLREKFDSKRAWFLKATLEIFCSIYGRGHYITHFFLGGIQTMQICKCMVDLRDFPCNSCLGWCPIAVVPINNGNPFHYDYQRVGYLLQFDNKNNDLVQLVTRVYILTWAAGTVEI